MIDGRVTSSRHTTLNTLSLSRNEAPLRLPESESESLKSDAVGTDPLPDPIVQPPGGPESDVRREHIIVPRSPRQEDHAMLEEVQGSAEVPERRDEHRHATTDTLEFGEHRRWIVNVFEGVAAEDRVEGARGMREPGHIGDKFKSWDVGVPHDVGIDPAPVRGTAADVVVPPTLVHHPALEHAIAQMIERLQEDDEDGEPREEDHEAARRVGGADANTSR